MIAIPLWDREAEPLREQLDDARRRQRSTTARRAVGPLGVLLTGAEGDGGWLIAGTRHPAALVRAADDVLDRFVDVDR